MDIKGEFGFGRRMRIGIGCLPVAALVALLLPAATARADEPLAVSSSYGAGVHAYYDGDYQTAYDALTAAIEAAVAETERPSVVVCRSHIGYGSPKRQDTKHAHGEPLGKDEVALAKKALGWPSTEPFHVPDEALQHWRTACARGAETQDAWRRRLIAYAKAQIGRAHV